MNASRNDDLPKFQKLSIKYSIGVDRPEKGMLGYTPLIAAVLADGTNVFNYLISRGVNVNAPSRDGETPLMMATMKGDVNAAKVIALIKAGALTNAKNRSGQSVLQYAHAAGASNIVTILKNNGANE